MAGPTPFGRLTAGLDWFGRSGRGAFIGALVVWAIFAGATAYGFGRFDWPGWAQAICVIGLALTTVPLFGQALRRLNDLGWSGWWAWLLLVPYAGAVLALLLAVRRGNPRRIATGSPLRLLGLIGVGMLAVLIVSRLFWTPYMIPTSSMKPTLLPGDYAIGTASTGIPAAGSVVVFRHPVTGQDLVKRVIGRPGDIVQMVDGLVRINGVDAAQTEAGFFDEVMQPQGPQGALPRCLNGAVGQGAICRKRRFHETLTSGITYDVLNISDMALDHTNPFTVPDGQLFVLGDNRDNSTDSRVAAAAGGVGMVPVDAVATRLRRVLFSAAGAHLWQVWTWRPGRFWTQVR